MKQLFIGLAVGLALTGALFAGGQAAAANPRDCDDNAIIKCGALTASELRQKYTANDTGDVDEVYTRYGISSIMVASSEVKMGEVKRNGSVLVDGKVVATGARSLGRTNLPGSSTVTIGGKRFYERPTSVSFAGDSISAFVYLNADGQFTAAILTSCGNPVKATPKPAPKPTPQPTPVYTCSSLVTTRLSETSRRFTVTASASNGATIKGYRYDFGDDSSQETTERTITHDYADAGDYQAKVTVLVEVNGTVKEVDGNACTLGVSVTKKEQPPAPAPKCDVKGRENIPKNDARCKETPTPEAPKEIAKTGPEALLGGGIGLSSLTAAAYYYRRSRHDMIATLLGRR